MSKGKLLGKGATAEVYAWGENQVLKLYFTRFGDDWISREAEVGRRVHQAGVPSPEVFGVIETEGRKGLLMERVTGKSMLWHVAAKPLEVCRYAEKLAVFQFEIHRHSGEGLPLQKERFTSLINDSKTILGARISRILEHLQHLPEGFCVCHGDLHFDNILCTGKGLVAIDWTHGCRGNPLGDVARTCLMFQSPTIPQGTPGIALAPYQFAKQVTLLAYIGEYMRLAKVGYDGIGTWMMPVAAARLREKVPGEAEWLMGIIDAQLKLT